MRIHQLVVGASPSDAVTECALRIRGALRTVMASEIYGVHVHPDLEGDVHRLKDFPRDGTAEDLLVYHVSIGDPGLTDFVIRSPERVVLAYHNITPAHFFVDFNPEFAGRLRDGRAELYELVDHAWAAVAVSQFNAEELIALGMSEVEVAAPPLNLGRLLDVEPDMPFVDDVAIAGEPLVLVVGQLLPHKRPDLAVDVQHLLNVNHFPQARMAIAGALRQPVFASAVVRHIESLRLSTVCVTGEVTDARLAALYRRASVLLIPSEHEGFCVPMVEAMSFGVPVVCRDFGALSETAAEAAMVLPAEASAADLCEAVTRVLSDDSLAQELRRRGFARAGHFDADATLARWMGALARAIRDGDRSGSV